MTKQNQKKSPEEQIVEIGYKNKIFNFLTDVKKENFLKCIKIIRKYNNFDYKLIKENFKLINLNYVNGSSLFTFKVGREFSPVIYITYNKFFYDYFDENKKLGVMHRKDFINLMYEFSEQIKADLITFEENEYYVNCKLWWG